MDTYSRSEYYYCPNISNLFNEILNRREKSINVYAKYIISIAIKKEDMR